MQLGHLPAVLHVPLAGLLEIRIFWWIWMEGVHSCINNTFSEDLKSSYPPLEVLRASVKTALQLVKPEYENGLDSLHEVWPQLIVEVLHSIIWIYYSFSIQKGFCICWHLRPVLLSSSVPMCLGLMLLCVANDLWLLQLQNQEILPSNDGATFEGKL